MSDEAPEPEPSEALIELVELAMNHALDSVSEGGPLVPFVMFTKAGARSLQRFMAGGDDEETWDLGRSVDQAREFAASLAGKAELAAIAIDGRVEADEGLLDCMFVEAFEHATPHSFCFGQCYQPVDEEHVFDLIGEGLLLDVTDPMW